MDKKEELLRKASILDTFGFGAKSSGRAKAYFRGADRLRRQAKK